MGAEAAYVGIEVSNTGLGIAVRPAGNGWSEADSAGGIGLAGSSRTHVDKHLHDLGYVALHRAGDSLGDIVGFLYAH